MPVDGRSWPVCSWTPAHPSRVTDTMMQSVVDVAFRCTLAHRVAQTCAPEIRPLAPGHSGGNASGVFSSLNKSYFHGLLGCLFLNPRHEVV